MEPESLEILSKMGHLTRMQTLLCKKQRMNPSNGFWLQMAGLNETKTSLWMIAFVDGFSTSLFDKENTNGRRLDVRETWFSVKGGMSFKTRFYFSSFAIK